MDCENKKKLAREFCYKVKVLAEKYNLPSFVVTDGASATSNNGCDAVKNARDNHIEWEMKMVLILMKTGAKNINL